MARECTDRFPDRTPIREYGFPVTYSKFPVPISREFLEKAQAGRGVFMASPSSKAPKIT
jgi:hypothetical protein